MFPLRNPLAALKTVPGRHLCTHLQRFTVLLLKRFQVRAHSVLLGIKMIKTKAGYNLHRLPFPILTRESVIWFSKGTQWMEEPLDIHSPEFPQTTVHW